MPTMAQLFAWWDTLPNETTLIIVKKESGFPQVIVKEPPTPGQETLQESVSGLDATLDFIIANHT